MSILLDLHELPSDITEAVSTVYNCPEASPLSALIYGTFVYGSGGATADFWVQTSYDSGGSWADVVNFHFTTSSVKSAYNISSNTSITTAFVTTDGALSANSCKDGILGRIWRVKYTLVGTYVATSVVIGADFKGVYGQ